MIITNSMDMEQLIELSQTEIKLAFVASCIESTARTMGKSYQEIFIRMKQVGMIKNYILSNYKIFHTLNREYVVNAVIESSPIIKELILSYRIGQIATELAKRLDIDPVRALELFYSSKTCANLHNKETGLYLYGNLYIADEFIREKEY